MSTLLLLSTTVVADASGKSTAMGLVGGGVFLLVMVVFVVCVLRAKASGEYDEVAKRQAEREKRLKDMARSISNTSRSIQNVGIVDAMTHTVEPPTNDWKCSICYESSPNPVVDGTDVECPDTEADASRPFVQFPGCDHTFHHTCCRNWFKTLSKKNKQFSCPLCRTVVDSESTSTEPTENV